MSAPGRFLVVAVEGQVVTIENENGVRKLVLAPSLRSIGEPSSPPPAPPA